MAAAGGELSSEVGLDGVNLLPHLTGETEAPPHEALYWRFGPQWAIRKGNWKLLQAQEAHLDEILSTIARGLPYCIHHLVQHDGASNCSRISDGRVRIIEVAHHTIPDNAKQHFAFISLGRSLVGFDTVK